MKFFNSIKGLFKRIFTPHRIFEDAIWKANRFDIAMGAIELKTKSITEQNRYVRFETERSITIDVDIIKMLNSLGIMVGDTVKLNIIDNRDIGSNLLQDNKNKLEIITVDVEK